VSGAPSPPRSDWRELAEEVWYGRHPLALALAPLGWMYAAAVGMRRVLYRAGALPRRRVSAPVIVVGNICVGGTGKTPLVIWIARHLRAAGLSPGVVCRGYGGAARIWPQQVRADSDPVMVGDEAILLARHTGCPVAAAGSERAAAARALVTQQHCDIVVSDDGLQHLELCRDIEIAVLDGVRRHGNGRCLPAGPLREPRGRLRRVDFVVAKGLAGRGEIEMRLAPGSAVSVGESGISRALSEFRGAVVHALCGIGNPRGFFTMLTSSGIEIVPHEFPDHHRLSADDIVFRDGRPVLMTEKDAVKCTSFADTRHWYVPVEAILPADFEGALCARLVERAPQLAHSLRGSAAGTAD